MRKALLILLVLAGAAQAEHEGVGNKGRSFADILKSNPLDACGVQRGVATQPRPAPVVRPFSPGPKENCEEACPRENTGRLICTFEIFSDDILDTRSATGFSDCEIKNFLCKQWSEEGAIAAPTGGGPAQKIFQGPPDKMVKKSCGPVPTEPSGKCGLTPKVSDTAGRACTLGGPMTYYYDKNLKGCVSYQNLGSCDASGPFSDLASCTQAVNDKKCE